MMKGVLPDETMSSLTPNNNNINEFVSPASTSAPPAKKKRNLPGNPDPEAEVVALSPTTLMATNRFVCEICNKGFQRDQNLQLHRRGHNLPWKLKQRSNKEVVRKKVYVCPEETCVHHHPSRALGDLTGIKKHFCRKHGEKKWKCDKCSKRYAVQSDWKAHTKICGTREYRCDCGTLFSRRDSFITHRAFCDALAEENARSSSSSIIPNPLFPSLQTQQKQHQLHSHGCSLQAFPLKMEQQDHPQQLQLPSVVPPWLPCPPSSSSLEAPSSSTLFSSRMLDHENPNPNNDLSTLASFEPNTAAALCHSPHMSATGLLQKAAQIGVTMSHQHETILRPHQLHMTPPTDGSSGLGLLSSSSRDEIPNNLMFHGLISFGDKATISSACMEQMCSATAQGGGGGGAPPLQASSSSAFQMQEALITQSSSTGANLMINRSREGGSGSGQEGLTRDFLGLKAFPHRDQFMNNIAAAGLDRIAGRSSSHGHHHKQQIQNQNQNQPPWQN